MLLPLRLYLESLDPRLWHVTVGLLVFLGVYLWRKLLPKSFALLPPKVQALPAVVLGIALSSSAGQNVPQMMIDAVFGALAGWQAIGQHEFLKRSPGPYGTVEKGT